MVEWELGHRKRIFDLIVTELVTDGTFRVIKRNRLDEILAEQNLGDSSRANPSTAARIGKVLGVNTMIVGNITQFGTEQRRKDSAELSEKSEASVEVPRHPERCILKVRSRTSCLPLIICASTWESSSNRAWKSLFDWTGVIAKKT